MCRRQLTSDEAAAAGRYVGDRRATQHCGWQLANHAWSWLDVQRRLVEAVVAGRACADFADVGADVEAGSQPGVTASGAVLCDIGREAGQQLRQLRRTPL